MEAQRKPQRRWRPAKAIVAVGMVSLALTGIGIRTASQGTTKVPPPVQYSVPQSVPLPVDAKALPEALRSEVYQTVQQTSAQWGLSPALIYGVIETESRWNPFVSSRDGAIGLMQLMPATARQMAWLTYHIPDMAPGLLYDPTWNIRLGTAYLALLARTQTDLPMALSAYNSGSPTAAMGYAQEVLTNYSRYARLLP